MTAIFTVAGISIASEIVQQVLNAHGHGDKAPFIKIICYVACAYVAFNFVWDGIGFVKRMFGVRF